MYSMIEKSQYEAWGTIRSTEVHMVIDTVELCSSWEICVGLEWMYTTHRTVRTIHVTHAEVFIVCTWLKTFGG